jgi:glycosyltransferase involved in cell wall biosynthesis
MSIMANYWAAHDAKVTLITLADDAIQPFYELHPAITLVPLGVAEESGNALTAAMNNLRRVYKIRNAIKASNGKAVISFITETNVLACLACLGLHVPLIISERTEPSMEYPGRFWSLLRKITYPTADHLVIVSEYARNFFSGSVHKNAVVIPNPVMQPAYSATDRHNPANPTVIAMGRFDHQKGFDLLLKAFSIVSARHPEWKLTILGDGPLRPDLEGLCNELDISSRVEMPGVVKNPYDYLKQGEIFVLSSRYEGFPNSLCEAMASGLAAISFDCKTGPSEIIRNGVDGVLVPPEDIGELAMALENVISDEKLRSSLKQNATQVLGRFGIDNVMNMWSTIISHERL